MSVNYKTTKDNGSRLPLALVVVLMSLAYILFISLSANGHENERPFIQPRILRADAVVGIVHRSGKPAAKPYCSFNAFRRMISELGSGAYLSGSGTWTGRGSSVRFHPSVCRLEHGIDIPSDEIVRCMRRKKIKNIVLLGDSNGLRYFDWLARHMDRLDGVDCEGTPENNVVNWTTYDRQHMHVVRRCRCGQPTASGRCAIGYKPMTKPDGMVALVSPRYRQQRCRFPGGSSVVSEYTYAQNQLDYPVEGKFWGCQVRPGGPVVPATGQTEGEFLLDHFYADPRPDLILFFDNAHDRMLLAELDVHMDIMSRLIDRYVRPPTKLIWMSRVGEYVKRKPTKWRKMRYENRTMSRLQWLEAANRIAFDRLHRVMFNGSKLVLFPDLLGMSLPVLSNYSGDGVHLKAPWYQTVISYILQALCTE